jgi:hemerythrin-like domain-containing protein
MNENSHQSAGGCDPFQMVMIHRTFRTEFGNLPDLIRSVAPGDTKRANLVGDYLGSMISVLHHHHAAEDDLLWPALRSRTSALDDDVQRAETAHRNIAELIDKVESIRPSWTDSGEPRRAVQLSTAVDELCAGANEHFDHEEQNVVPLIAEHITPKEWQAVIDRGAAYVNPTNLWFSLAYAGVLLRSGTPEEQRRFIASIPLPLRIVLKLVGRRAFASYQTRLHGKLADR